MATSYRSPIAVIHEISEDEKGGLKSQDEGSAAERTHRRSRSSQEATMATTKANISKERERERERSKRYHRSTPSGSTSNRHTHTSSRKTKNTSAKRTSGVRERKSEHDHEGRSRHRRSHSSRSRDLSSSSSSSSEEETPAHSHRIVLPSARARLTSPSTISNLTSLTSTTNKSSSSSGSNSTVTQASVTKRTTVEKKSDIPDGPMSPAVPDAPNVFAYLDPDGSVAGSKVDLGSTSFEPPSRWEISSTRVESSLPTHMLQVHASSSSSASSSFHGDDNSSEAAHDMDTDRSTSPERSTHEEEGEFEEEEEEEEKQPEESIQDDTSAKIASQIAAAQQRQNYHGQIQAYGTPDMQRGPANLPHIPSTALSTRPQQQQIKQHPLPRAEKLPVTGYELLASQLSSRATPATEGGEKIKPIYRKFEALNHRLLLHLQDELSELEEQLHRLDHTDTQSRRMENNNIIPASRRASAAAGGELQWHKTDILGKIGYKLAQYNQALASFNSTRSLAPANREDVSSYRTYLQTAHPITEAETHFLDPEDDLVSIFSEQVPESSTASYTASSTTSYDTSQDSSTSSSSYTPSFTESKSRISSRAEGTETKPSTTPDHIQAFALALAVSILVPILAFSTIPGLLGRITAASLVVGGVLAVLIQGGVVGREMLMRSEGLVCTGVYAGVMVVVAGLF